MPKNIVELRDVVPFSDYADPTALTGELVDRFWNVLERWIEENQLQGVCTLPDGEDARGANAIVVVMYQHIMHIGVELCAELKEWYVDLRVGDLRLEVRS